MFKTLKLNLIKKKYINKLKNLSEDYINNLMLKSKTKKEIREKIKGDFYIYGIKLYGPSKIDPNYNTTITFILKIDLNDPENNIKIQIKDEIEEFE